MCKFEMLHGNDFKIAYKYLEKHYGTHTEDEWEAISNEMEELSKKPLLARKLIIAVLGELELVCYEAGKEAGGDDSALIAPIMIPKRNQREQIVAEHYRPMFANAYKFAKRCYYADSRNPSHEEELGFIRGALENSKSLSPFESDLFEGCYEVLFRVVDDASILYKHFERSERVDDLVEQVDAYYNRIGLLVERLLSQGDSVEAVAGLLGVSVYEIERRIAYMKQVA